MRSVVPCARRAQVVRAVALVTGILVGIGSVVVLPSSSAASAGQTVNDVAGGVTATQMAQTIAGTGITVSNATYVGRSEAAGTFSGMDVMGFDSGVVLATGAISNVLGPNNSDRAGNAYGSAGDASLNPLAGGSTVDAAVLEFDFVATDPQVHFDYVFGSEEYDEYIEEGPNDVMALWINGVNCAVVDDPPVMVRPRTVNKNVRTAWYRNNVTGGIDFELDGLTTVLDCAATVTAGATSHAKFAIADVSQAGWDSDVFIQAGSFKVDPPATAPSAPTNPTATAGNAQATVSWTAPTSTGGSPITGYVVTPYIGAAAQTPQTFNSTATTQTITGLTNGTTYTFKVAAKNAVGTGQQSAASNAVTPATVPGAPTIGTATAGNAQATVTWTAPASNGGSAITGYVVTPYIGAAAQTPQTFNSTATSQTVTGLTNGTTYTFKVAAKNAVGTGLQSAASNAVTPAGPVATVPGAPTIGTAIAGDAQVSLSWTAPANNGGSPITGYVVTPYVNGNPQTPQTFNSTSNTQIITGLTNGTTYTFKVAAKNAVGTGQQSAASNAVTPVGDPGEIISAGPLTNIATSPDLNCSVEHEGDTHGAWYESVVPKPVRACGTFVAVGGTVYGPAAIPAGPDPEPFTPISQTAASGDGTEADPLTIVTVVAVGGTGLQLTQTDSYVLGQETFRTDVALTNTGGGAVDAVVYRAGDCFLDDSDKGLGELEGGSVSCKALPDAPQPDRLVQFVPIGAGSHAYEAGFSAVWTKVMSGLPFPDTCLCDEAIDNGLGLSWSVTIPAGGTTTSSHLTVFSPIGAKPLRVSKTVDDATIDLGAADGYTITISNPAEVSATLTSITDTLPVGFAYTPGTTTGLTTTNPTVAGRDVTWTGTFVVPGAVGVGPGTATLHFSVVASTTAGTYTNSAAAEGDGLTVLPAIDVAPVSVAAATVPGAPTIGAAIAGNAQVALSWSAPTNDGRAAIDGYVVTPYIGAAAQAPRTFDSTATNQTITGLTNGTTYTFKVAARNRIGVGLQSAASAPATPATVPGAPTIGAVTPGDKQVTVSWTAPASNGGAAVNGYVVTPYIGAAAQTARTFDSTATTQTVTGLTNGTAYTFKVAARNAIGTGAQSAASAAATPTGPVPTAPGAPTIGVATAGHGNAVLSWTAPASNGGSAITAYVVTPYIGAAAQTPQTFNSTATTQTITGLTNGTTYTFKVAAKNAVGTGAQSGASNAVTPTATVPGKPIIGVVTPGNASATVRWTPPVDDGGSAITGYVVTPYIGAAAQTPQTFNSTAATQVVTGLTNGTTYTFKVAAKNVAGTGPQSDASDPVTPATVPGAPTIGTATPGNAQVVLSWTAPANNGGAAIDGYVVTPYIDGNPQTVRTFNSTSTSQPITGLANGTTYTFKVAARNAIGTGPQSAASSAATPATVPGAPTIGTATAGPGSGQATVTWTAPASNGGSPVTGYVVTPYLNGAPQTPRTFDSTATTQTITGLTGGAYTFRVAAKNVMGTGLQSAASNAVTPDVTAPTATMGALPRWSLSRTITPTWSATDTGGSGLKDFDVQSQAGSWNGTLNPMANWLFGTTATTSSFVGAKGATYCITARGRDNAGNVGSWAAKRCVAIPLTSDQVAYGSGWTKQTSSLYYGGFAYRTTTLNAKLTRTGIKGTKRVSLVATRCPTCGSVKVYWNGVYKKTVSLVASTDQRKSIVDLLGFGSATDGTLDLVVSTSGKPVIVEGLGTTKTGS